MMTMRDWLIFFAGAEAFHTLSHAILCYSNTLPITVFSFTFTQQMNMWAIIINAVITVALLWAAHKA